MQDGFKKHAESEKLDITVQKPRTCQVQHNRANIPAETVEGY